MLRACTLESAALHRLGAAVALPYSLGVALLAVYPMVTVSSGQGSQTNAGQWTSGFLAGYFWQMATFAASRAPGMLLSRAVPHSQQHPNY